jgi:hypothetical protein
MDCTITYYIDYVKAVFPEAWLDVEITKRRYYRAYGSSYLRRVYRYLVKNVTLNVTIPKRATGIGAWKEIYKAMKKIENGKS